MEIIVVAAGIGAFFLWSLRQRELFCISVRDSRLLVVRGRVPAGLFQAFQDALANPPVRRGTVKAIREARGAVIRASGDIDEFREQRLRNIFGTYPVSQYRSAPVDQNRTLGQLLGIAWLAWLLDRR